MAISSSQPRANLRRGGLVFAVSMCSSHLTCFYRSVLAAKVWLGERAGESVKRV